MKYAWRRWPNSARTSLPLRHMPRRETKRGKERKPLSGRYDVVVCGASFAGLTVARQLAGTGARVLMLDRYEIGERQTSACGIPTDWLRVMGLMGSHRQTFDRLVVHPFGAGEEMEIWIDRRYVPAGYGWSFPAGDELRIGVGSFDPRFRVKDTTVLLAEDLERDPVRYQGNWIPHRLRPATDDGIFFVGDSAGHCLPLTAEGIRTALYFGIACGRELRAVVEGRQSVASALVRYGDFSAAHKWKFRLMLQTQRLVPRVQPRVLNLALKGISKRRFVEWSFDHYLAIAPPKFARPAPPPVRRAASARAAA